MGYGGQVSLSSCPVHIADAVHSQDKKSAQARQLEEFEQSTANTAPSRAAAQIRPPSVPLIRRHPRRHGLLLRTLLLPPLPLAFRGGKAPFDENPARPGRTPRIPRKRRGQVDPGSALLLRRRQDHPRRCALPPSSLLPMLTSEESPEMRPTGRPGGGCPATRTAHGRNGLVRRRLARRTAHKSGSVPRYVPRPSSCTRPPRVNERPRSTECSAKMGRGVREAITEAARVAIAKGRPVSGAVGPAAREGRRSRCVVL